MLYILILTHRFRIATVEMNSGVTDFFHQEIVDIETSVGYGDM